MSKPLHVALANQAPLKDKIKTLIGSYLAFFTKAKVVTEKSEYIHSTDDTTTALGESKPAEKLDDVKGNVSSFLKEIFGAFTHLMSIDATNASGNTSVDVVIGNENVGTYSAIELLQISIFLKDVKTVIDKIPVLPSDRVWTKDSITDNYITTPYEVAKLDKVIGWTVVGKDGNNGDLVKEYSRQEKVGTYVRTAFSSALSPTEKVELIDKIDKLALAINEARALANNTEIVYSQASKICDYLLK